MKIEDLNEIINNRAQTRKKNSYTNKLLKLGPKKIAQKFGEESSELIIDFLKGSKKRTTEEAVDVIYHLLILLKSKKITINDINPQAKIHVLGIPKFPCRTFSDFLKNADDENITSFFKSVQLVINNINIENTGYRLISNSGEDGGQEVPHFHIHILAGEKIGKLR